MCKAYSPSNIGGVTFRRQYAILSLQKGGVSYETAIHSARKTIEAETTGSKRGQTRKLGGGQSGHEEAPESQGV